MNAITVRTRQASTDTEAYDLAEAEREAIGRLGLVPRLRAATEDLEGLRRFAAAFYFIRVGFVRHNFLLGARCPPSEALWGPIAKNLWEELGAGGAAHNELYRRFMRGSGIQHEGDLKAPAFALAFDQSWESFITTAPLPDALIALAIYESLDGPDYSALLGVLEPRWAAEVDLEFFSVHAEARHLDLFADMQLGLAPDELRGAIERATTFVQAVQRQMWIGLLDHVELH